MLAPAKAANTAIEFSETKNMPAIEMIIAINAEIMKLREGGSDIK